MSTTNRSYSQKKRDKLDYRREYFRKNPGIFGCIWTCAYCHRPLVGKQNVQVDHIMPLNSLLGRNASYNLVAACGKCNRNKSDNVDGRVVIGYISKLFEVIIFTIQKVVIICVVAIWVAIQKTFSLIYNLGKKLLSKTSIWVKLALLVCVIVIYYFYTNH